MRAEVERAGSTAQVVALQHVAEQLYALTIELRDIRPSLELMAKVAGG
jgi:hypothetical protein